MACTHVAAHVQVVLYHRHACEAVDEDSLLELADWAVRKLTYLNSGAHRAAAAKGEDNCALQASCTPRPAQLSVHPDCTALTVFNRHVHGSHEEETKQLGMLTA